MAEVLASLKKIGGNGEKYTETVLWTNPNTSVDFDSQTVTLSDSIGNYKYIKFVYLFAKGNTVEMDWYVATDKLRMTSGTNGSFALGLNNFGTSSGTLYPWSRVVYYVSDTSILFHPARAVNALITQNQRLIPKEILGVNELAHGEGVLATPFQLTLKSTIANGRSVIEFDKSTFPYTKFRVISKTNNLRYIGNGSWVTLAVGDIVDFSALPDTRLTIDVSGSNTSTTSTIEFYN